MTCLKPTNLLQKQIKKEKSKFSLNEVIKVRVIGSYTKTYFLTSLPPSPLFPFNI